MKIKVATYKNSSSLFSSFIRFQQRFLQWLPQRNARFSHAEVVFEYVDDQDVLNMLEKIESIYFWKSNRSVSSNRKKFFENHNLWFSSSEWDWWTRFKFIEDNKNNWKYYEFDVSKQDYIKALEYCMSESNNAYWWLSIIFTQALKTLWFVDRKSPFCSQIVIQVMQKIWFFCWANAIEINPGRLSEMIEQREF